jgi:hypothetical protein
LVVCGVQKYLKLTDINLIFDFISVGDFAKASSAQRMELLQLLFQVFQVRRLIPLGAADVFVSTHVLNDSYVMPSRPLCDHARSDLAGLPDFIML